MEKQIQFNHGTLNYSLRGKGPSLVFLHGFLEDHSIWNTFADHLSQKFQVVCIDLPGFGKSSVFGAVHSMEMMASCVNQVLEHENIQSCQLTGHSMGGYVALSFAELFPAKLLGLVLFHSQAGADDEQSKINRNRTIDAVRQNHQQFISSFIPMLFANENTSIFSKEINQLKELAMTMPAEGILAALAGMRDRKDMTSLLEKLAFPVFFIIGKQDSRISFEKVFPQVSLPKNSEAIIMDNVGHMGFIEAKNITLRAVEQFFKRNYLFHLKTKK